mgnify:CR=1 FL=1
MTEHSTTEPASRDSLVPLEWIERAILLIRRQKVMLDRDLAELYGVETRVLNQAVRRHRDRFPPDFLLSLTREEIRDISQVVTCPGLKHAKNVFAFTEGEFANLRCQFGTSSQWGGRRYPPLAFTEQGVAMLSSVLNSEQAVEVNIAIMRAFVRLRELMASHADLARKLEELEERYDEQFRIVFDAIRQLMTPPETGRRKIGFGKVEEEPGRYLPLRGGSE